MKIIPGMLEDPVFSRAVAFLLNHCANRRTGSTYSGFAGLLGGRISPVKYRNFQGFGYNSALRETMACIVMLVFGFCSLFINPEEARAAGKTVWHVAITQIVEHPALDACRRGVVDALASHGYEKGKNLKISFENAQGNNITAVQIAKKFVGLGPDVIIAIATPAAQAVAASTRKIPLVFSAVTDPVGARLVRQWEKPGGNITGVSDMLPVKAHLQMIRKAMPKSKRLGVVYNPGEANSVSLLTMLKKQAPALGFSIHEAAASRSSEVLQAARSLTGKIDAFYIFTDNTVVSAFEAVVKTGREAKIPVFAGDTASVKRGAVAALGFDYYEVGRQTGEIAVKILQGGKPGDIDVSLVKKLDLFVNPGSARTMGLELPAGLIRSARKIIK